MPEDTISALEMGLSCRPFSSFVEGVSRGVSKRWFARMPAGSRMPETGRPFS